VTERRREFEVPKKITNHGTPRGYEKGIHPTEEKRGEGRWTAAPEILVIEANAMEGGGGKGKHFY